MKALPNAFRNKVKIIRQSKGINDNAVNVDIIIRVTYNLVSSITSNKIDSAIWMLPKHLLKQGCQSKLIRKFLIKVFLSKMLMPLALISQIFPSLEALSFVNFIRRSNKIMTYQNVKLCKNL